MLSTRAGWGRGHDFSSRSLGALGVMGLRAIVKRSTSHPGRPVDDLRVAGRQWVWTLPALRRSHRLRPVLGVAGASLPFLRGCRVGALVESLQRDHFRRALWIPLRRTRSAPGPTRNLPLKANCPLCRLRSRHEQ